MKPSSALLIVDLQNDFCEGGALAVAGASAIIPLVNQLQPQFDLIIATQDWHPADHTSFAFNHPGHKVGEIINLGKTEQILWPIHCVQESEGAKFHSQLDTTRIQKIFYKGTDPQIDSYSAFYDNQHLRATGLADYLHAQEVKDVYILGLATDYCVKYSALDARHSGFNVYIIEDACRGVNLAKDDSIKAFNEMRAAGIQLVKSQNIIS